MGYWWRSWRFVPAGAGGEEGEMILVCENGHRTDTERDGLPWTAEGDRCPHLVPSADYRTMVVCLRRMAVCVPETVRQPGKGQ